MTEAAENVETQNDAEISAPEPQANQNNHPPGYHPVDISDLPEDKQKLLNDRFGYYHRQVKDLQRKTSESDRAIREWQENAAREIQALTSGVGQIVDHMEARTIGESEAEIKREMKEAFESGDSERHASAVARLTELQSKKAAQVKKTEKQQQNPQKNETQQQAHAGYNDAYSVAVEAVTQGELPPEKIEYVTEWQNEKDESGQLKRPWAFNPSGGVPQPGSGMDIAMKELASIAMSPTFGSMPFERQLAELDRRMGVRNMNGAQSVMGGNLTRPQKTNSIKLSPDEERLAVRMKFGGPKAKTDADHIKAWRENKEKVQAKQKRSR